MEIKPVYEEKEKKVEVLLDGREKDALKIFKRAAYAGTYLEIKRK